MSTKYGVDLNTLEVVNFDSDDEVIPPEQPKKTKKRSEKKKDEDNDDEGITLNKGFKFDIDGETETMGGSDWNFLVDEESKSKVNKPSSQMDREESDEDDDEEQEDEDDDEEQEDEDENEEEEECEDDEQKGDSGQDNDLKSMAKEKNKNADESDDDSEEAIANFFETSKVSDANTKQKLSFTSLQLSRPILKSLAELNYLNPTPIQKESIPIALLGKDIVAGAETGSGKTAAYMIPIIERLLFKPSKVNMTRVLVLTPTRELSIQVSDVTKKLSKYCNNITMGLAVGGLNLRKQEQELKNKPDIVIATPGRIIDHIRNSPSFNVENVEVLVVDEADRMLEEGFQKELTEILSLLPKNKRQTLLFSATMNSKIKDLIQLSLDKPVRIMINPPNKAASKLTQEFVRIRKREESKSALLYKILKSIDPKQQHRIVVFVARKEMAHRLKVILQVLGIKTGELHGSLSQEQRLISVTNFKNLSVPVLICTDLAARGLDIPKIEVVINFDMPKSYEIYLHRVGRTARANREGKSISFVGESSADRSIVKDALKSLSEKSEIANKAAPTKKAISRNVDWNEVEEISNQIKDKQSEIEEVLELEKQQKEIEIAERDIKRGENLLKYDEEIKSRPRRTWFTSSKDEKKQAGKAPKKVNRMKRKRIEEKASNSHNFGKAAKKASKNGKDIAIKSKKKGKK